MKIVVTDFAKEEMQNIYKFYKDNASKYIADKLRTGILTAIKKISQNPEIGQIEEYLTDLNLGHRRIVEGNYKIIYKVEGKVVYVTDIFDTRRNPDTMMG